VEEDCSDLKVEDLISLALQAHFSATGRPASPFPRFSLVYNQPWFSFLIINTTLLDVHDNAAGENGVSCWSGEVIEVLGDGG
jgi:hypothetical protein